MPAPVREDSFPNLEVERGLWTEGYRVVVGIDEAGRGAWAGPVVAAAVVFEPTLAAGTSSLAPVRDSKLLSARQRDVCYDVVLENAWFWGIGALPAAQIDAIGILNATRQAMTLAVQALACSAEYLLIDAVRLSGLAFPQQAIVRGDRQCLSIAAASILAKVTRDRMMRELERAIPGYGFCSHKGYGTSFHRAALDELGPSAVHRYSYAPVAALRRDPSNGRP